MSVQEIYTKGARVWVPDPDLVWRGAQLVENYTSQSELQIVFEEDGVVDEAHPDSISLLPKGATSPQLPPLRNPDILIGENDLTSLSYLNEPEVLYNLQVRFSDRHEIYTYCGIVLVAINPYQELSIYGSELIAAYSGQDMGSMDPHIFAVAEEAFKRMSSFDQNQSVIVSGESGAGKTVSAKYTMRFFASVGGSNSETQIERRVLASNPLLEAVGNAKTTRNDNSSRFGKFIEIGFSRHDRIVGANLRTYLLEKSRVVFQGPEERNYHVFYQLCSARDAVPEFGAFELDHQDNFFYTSQGGAPDIDDVDDIAEFENTREALSMMGVGPTKQIAFFQVLAGILHMGNVPFSEAGQEGSTVPKKDPHLLAMCRLLGIPADQMRTWLCHRSIAVIGETVTKPLTPEEAANARDALAKHIYAELFRWTVDHVNKALATKERYSKFIGVLDIYGFETFEVNSFEQFCINYANEKLQQQFNMHVFKLEQEEYIKESIEWSFIDFYDNQPCIDLIENKLGILDLLDEECKMPKGSDANWCQKLYQKHLKGKSAAHFSKPKMSNQAFIISHFADSVEYYSVGFLEKNRDTVLQEQLNILKASDVDLVAALFVEEEKPKAKTRGNPGGKPFQLNLRQGPAQPSKAMRQTVGNQFRESLGSLMSTLNSTTPHYVRCIKPNDEKLPFTFCASRAVQQLRACGVLETVRISAAGFPSRWSYVEFFMRYRVLARWEDIDRRDPKATCIRMVEALIKDEDKFRFGRTKLFFRAGQVAFFEKRRADRFRECVVAIQRRVRGFLARRRYARMRAAVLGLQTLARAWLARRRARDLRERRAALRIQTAWRGHRIRCWYHRVLSAVLLIQARWRRYVLLRHRRRELYTNSAIVIQTSMRGWLARRNYRKVLRGIVLLQSHYRRRKARVQFKLLRIEARSIGHMQAVNRGLENKIIELQQRLDVRSKEVGELQGEKEKLTRAQVELERLSKAEESAVKSAGRLGDLEAEVLRLRAELEKERNAKAAVEREKTAMAKEHAELVEVLRQEKVALNGIMEGLETDLGEKTAEVERLSSLNKDLEQRSSDLPKERENHQLLLGEYARLQQKFENLYRDYTFVSSGSGHPPSRNSSTRGSYRRNDHRRQLSDVSDISSMRGGTSGDAGSSGTPAGEDGEAHEELNADDAQNMDGNAAGESNVFVLVTLRKKIDELTRDNKRLRTRLGQTQERLNRAANGGSGGTADDEEASQKALADANYYSLKTQELEVENGKLKRDLDSLRKASSKNSASKEVVSQLEAMRLELDSRREECVQLRSILASKERMVLANDNYGGQCDLINEDGELELAFKTQKEANRRLQTELEKVLKEKEAQFSDFEREVDDLRTENERLNRIIGQLSSVLSDMSMSTEQKLDACMQHEITRLTADNLDLRECTEVQEIQIRKLKKLLRSCATKLRRHDGATADLAAEWDEIERLAQYAPSVTIAHREEREDRSGEEEEDEDARRERTLSGGGRRGEEAKGMLEFRRDDEQMLLRNLIYELQPRLAVTLQPALPAYILFMCIRYTDSKDDDESVRSLLSNSISAIRRVVKKRSDNLEVQIMWLANTHRLLNCLKQYSGDPAFTSENSPRQNAQCLANFDLSDFRQILNDLSVFIYQSAVRLIQEEALPTSLIIAAVLDHEGICGLSASKPTGMRGRSASAAGQEVTIEHLLKKLSNLHRLLCAHGLELSVTAQIFDQACFWIGAHALNNLLLRKDLCNWSRGMQIRYNLSQLEGWLREHNLPAENPHLRPMTQASQLLQAKKTDENVVTVCDMCHDLRTPQIIKLLNLYTPVDEYETRVSVSLIRSVGRQLETSRDASSTNQPLLVNTKSTAAVNFPFSASHVTLETLQLPDALQLGFLRRL